jgi:hypothetical protein
MREVPSVSRGRVVVVSLVLALVAVEAALRVPAVRDSLPERRIYYDPAVSVRLDALDNVLREHGRVDVLFAGSSIIRTNVRPLVFDSLIEAGTGEQVVSFNTGMLGLWPAGTHLYLERVWLPEVQPAIVVQGIRYAELRATTYALKEDQFFGGVIERGWGDAGWTDRTVSWATGRFRLLQYRGVLPARLHAWLQGRPGEPDLDGRSAVNERGFGERWPLLPDTRARGLLDDAEVYDDPCVEGGCDVGLAAIRRAHALVAEHGAEFVLVDVPEFAARWPGEAGAERYRSYLATLQRLADEEGFRFIDITRGNPAHFSDEREFSDYYHMSPIGATRFTSELAAVLAPFIATRASDAPAPEESLSGAAVAVQGTGRGSLERTRSTP